MKKTLIAMAAVAVTGGAMAQVTISGSLGFGVQDSSTTAKSIGWTDTYINFSASEDLGGGMSITAKQSLQGVGGDTADVTSNGTSLSLAGGFGAITFASVGAGADNLSVASLPSSTNTVFGGSTNAYTYLDYTTPTLVDGLTVVIRANQGNSDAIALTDENLQYRVDYKSGPFSANFRTTTGSAEAGGSFDFGVAKISFQADTTRAEAAASSMKRTAYSLVVPVSGALTASMSSSTRAAFTGESEASGTEFNATYALSKRTSLSINYGTMTDTSDVDTSAHRVKLVHSF